MVKTIRNLILAIGVFATVGSVANASPGVNYLQNLTQTSNYSYTGATDITVSGSIAGSIGVTVNETLSEIYTLSGDGKTLLVKKSTDGSLVKSIVLLDSASPAFSKVILKYQPTSGKLFIYGISGVGTLTFPTNATLTLESANNAFVILTVDTNASQVEALFSVGSGALDTIADSVQFDSFNNFFINGGLDMGSGSSQGFITKVNLDATVSTVAVFTGTTNIVSSTQKIGNTGYIAGKNTDGSYFISQLDLETFAGTGTVMSVDNATIHDIFYNKSNNNIYALLTFVGNQTINGNAYTNTSGTDTLVLALDETFTTTQAFQFTGDGDINLNRMRVSEGNGILVYGDYTNALTYVAPNVANRGATDVAVVKFENGATSLEFNGAVYFPKTGANTIASLEVSPSGSYYYASIDGSVFALGNDAVYQSSGLCKTGETLLWVPATFDTVTNEYSYGTVLSNVENLSNEDDYTTIEAQKTMNSADTRYHIINNGFSYNGNTYTNGIATKNGTTVGNDAEGGTLTQGIVDTFKTQLLDSIDKSVTNDTVYAGNPGNASYADFYKGKGFHPSMLTGDNPNYYVDWNDFKNPATFGAKQALLSDWFIYGRNYGTKEAFIDKKTNNISTKQNNYVGGLKLTSNVQPTWFNNAGFDYPILPIKRVSDNITEGYFEYACGNLICEKQDCFAADAARDKSECGNGILEKGEACDSNTFLDEKTVAQSRALGYTVTCSNSCVQTTATPVSLNNSYKTQVPMCIPNNPPAEGYCGDLIIQNGLGGTVDLGEQCEVDSASCNSLTCKIKSGMYCGDGIAQTNTAKMDFKKLDTNNNTDFIDEECDGTVGCTLDCKLNPAPIPQCGDSIVQSELGEECDGGVSCTAGCRKVEEGYCGDNQVQASLGETCDGNAINPIGFNPATESCMSCVKAPKPVESGICGDSIIGNRADNLPESCDIGSVSKSVWDSKGCGYPTVPNPASNTGGTLPNPNACMSAVCGNAIVESGEGCDNGMDGAVSLNDGTTVKNGVMCSAMCKPVAVSCGDGVVNYSKTTASEYDEFGVLQTVEDYSMEQCDNGNANDGSTLVNGTACSNACKIVPQCTLGANTTEALSQNYNFLYIEPKSTPSKLEVWSYDKKKGIFSKKDATLPETADFLKYSQGAIYEKSTLTDSQLYIGKTKLEQGLSSLAENRVLKRNPVGIRSIKRNLQYLQDKNIDVLSVSFSLSDINREAHSSLRKMLFGYLLGGINGVDVEVATKSCSTESYETFGKLKIIGIINGDNDSISLIKRFGSIIPPDLYY